MVGICVFCLAKARVRRDNLLMFCSDWLIVSFLAACLHSVVRKIIVLLEFFGIVSLFPVQEYDFASVF